VVAVSFPTIRATIFEVLLFCVTVQKER